MPPTYFSRNCAKCAIALFGRKNSELQNTIFQHGHHHKLCHCAFSSAMNKSIRGVLVKLCTSRGAPLSPSPLLKCTTVFTSSVWSPKMFQQAWTNVTGCHFSCVENVSFSLLLHPHFHVWHHAVWLSFSCHLSQQQNVVEYWWKGSTSTAIQPT